MNTILCAVLGTLTLCAVDLPVGDAPDPVTFPHFPDRQYTFVWRNWPLVPVARMAEVIGTTPQTIERMGRSMGLVYQPYISDSQWKRSYLTIISRNWHLLPYEQLLQLLDWTPEQFRFTLREDDFLYVKLGRHKPKCDPIRYHEPDEKTRDRLWEISEIVRRGFLTEDAPLPVELFDFVKELSAPLPADKAAKTDTDLRQSRFSPRFCYSYFALYGDTLLDMSEDPFPEGLLTRLAACGVDGVWLQAVLYRIAPFPWKPEISTGYETRIENLRKLVARARKQGIGIYLYLNEPRAMPLSFFDEHPELKGVVEGDHAALCTSSPAVRKYLSNAIESLCRAVPDLAGIFTIAGSENLTNCWAHHKGQGCARCGPRGQADVLTEFYQVCKEAIDRAGGKQRYIVWDWGWMDEAADAIIERLPAGVDFMSVSEWGIPIERGGVKTAVGEYSMSVIGPGERAKHRWELARRKGLKTIAKIQAGNTWELSSVPYIPVVASVAQHAANVREAGVDGLMLGWTLGGYPSPNLEVVAEMGCVNEKGVGPTPEEAMMRVAERRFGPKNAAAVVKAWQQFSEAFSEFPYHGGTLYCAPLQVGPANLLWAEPTGYRATMVGFPYDDIANWCSVYLPPIFIEQLEKVADGFKDGIATLRGAYSTMPREIKFKPGKHPPEWVALRRECDVATVSAIHFQSAANQARFIVARDGLAKATTAEAARPLLAELERMLKAEINLARRLYAIQCHDSRFGFEASNQYNYVPIDLIEKVINARYLRERWLTAQYEKLGIIRPPSRRCPLKGLIKNK